MSVSQKTIRSTKKKSLKEVESERTVGFSLPFDTQDSMSESNSKISTAQFIMTLNAVKGIGRKSIATLIDAHNGDFEWLNSKIDVEVYAGLCKAKSALSQNLCDELIKNRKQKLEESLIAIELLEKNNVSIITGDEIPLPLRSLSDAPRWLFVQGNVKALSEKPHIAVVGTRNPSREGIKATGMVIKQIAAYPVTIVSGLAEGIDEEAHRTSLEANITNVAFLGHGINQIFPAKTKDLRQQIIEKNGAVVTEYLPGEHYQKSYFVQRNRLQAALAEVVIPVEASLKSGTAHTVRFAKNLNKKLIGITWIGANGILSELEKSESLIINIRSRESVRLLDKVIRKIAEDHGHETYAFSIAEKGIISDAKTRDVTKKDLQRLFDALLNVIEESATK